MSRNSLLDDDSVEAGTGIEECWQPHVHTDGLLADSQLSLPSPSFVEAQHVDAVFMAVGEQQQLPRDFASTEH